MLLVDTYILVIYVGISCMMFLLNYKEALYCSLFSNYGSGRGQTFGVNIRGQGDQNGSIYR